MIAAGRYQDVQENKIFVVLKSAMHWSGDYRLAIMHEEGKPDDWIAYPESVFNERIIKDKIEVTRFKKLGKEKEVAK